MTCDWCSTALNSETDHYHKAVAHEGSTEFTVCILDMSSADFTLPALVIGPFKYFNTLLLYPPFTEWDHYCHVCPAHKSDKNVEANLIISSLPGIALSVFAFAIWPFHIPARVYSIRFARHRKLKTLKYITIHSGVKTYTTQKVKVKEKDRKLMPALMPKLWPY